MNKLPVSVLLAQEDSFFGEIYKKKLEEVGFKVTVVRSGEACLKEVEKKHPRVLVLDLLLSHINGFDVIESIKKSIKTKHIPVIVLTHLGQKEDVKRALELGAQEYILKSHSSPGDLISKIQEILTI